tara:strand:- start:614 stop:865 length:252 start_codon:yes stop_codon:yes gene_type:complete
MLIEKQKINGNYSGELFKALMKTFSDNDVYGPINKAITTGKYEDVQGYMSLLLKNLSIFGKGFSIKELTKPIYRGINPSGHFN